MEDRDLLRSGDDGEPLQSFRISNLWNHKEPRHDEQVAGLDGGLKDTFPINPDHLNSAAAPDNVSHLQGRVAREARGAHCTAIQPNKIGTKANLTNQRQVLAVQNHHSSAFLDVNIKRSLQAVQCQSGSVFVLGIRQVEIWIKLDNAIACLFPNKGLRNIFFQVPGSAHELGWETGKDATGTGEEEVCEGTDSVGFWSIPQEEDHKLSVFLIVPPCNHTEGEGNGIALLYC